jgi:ribose transport system substrate-binding protein
MMDNSKEEAANWEARVSVDGLALPRRIGVCINYGAHIWYQMQSANERDLAAQLGIALEAVDANMNAERQTEQIKQFLRQGIDALIYSAAEPAKAPAMLEPVHAAGIPVITESLWVNSPAVKANVMINDYKGGQKVGRCAAEWIKASMTGPVKVLDVAAPWLEEGLQRSDGFLAGLRESFPNLESVRVDGRADIETSAKVAAEVLREDPTFNIIFGVDDESAIGGRLAYQRLKLPLENVLICSFGFSGPQAYDWLRDSVYHIVCAMFPEYQARMLVHAAIYAYNRRELPLHLVGPCVPLTAADLATYYTRTENGTVLNLDSVKIIPTVGEELHSSPKS